MNDQKKAVGKDGLGEKVELQAPNSSTMDTLAQALSVLIEKVSVLSDKVQSLEKTPAVNFGGNKLGTPPRADGINPGFDKVKGYQRLSRGYPVQEGQTWHDLTPAQRKEWFDKHENRWKQNYTAKAQRMGGGEMGWTRGYF